MEQDPNEMFIIYMASVLARIKTIEERYIGEDDKKVYNSLVSENFTIIKEGLTKIFQGANATNFFHELFATESDKKPLG